MEKRRLRKPFYILVGAAIVMYVAPRITDFGRIELHTHALPGSSPDFNEESAIEGGGGGGGGGVGLGLIGLIGGVAVLAGRGDNDQTEVTAPPDEEEEKAQK